MAIESACIPSAIGTDHAVRGIPWYSQGTMKLLWVATAGAIGCNLGSLMAYEIGCLRRPAAGRALRALDPDGPPRTGLGRPLLSALGTDGGFYRAPAARDSHIYCVAGRRRAHAARKIPYLYISGIVALVFGAGLVRNEAGRKLAVAGKYFHKMDAVIGVLLLVAFAWFVWSHWQNRLRTEED